MSNATGFGLERFANESSPGEKGAPDQAVIFCGFIIPFVIIGVIGHVLVLLSVLYHDALHRPLNVMIVNLSVSQCFMLTISVFGDVIVMLTNSDYDFQLDSRDILSFLTLLFSTSTSVFYGLIALNRLVSTVFESLYNQLRPWRMVWFLVVAGWLLSLLASIFPWISTDVDFYSDTYFILGAPWFHGRVRGERFWMLTCAYFIVPAVSSLICYVIIFLYTSKSQRLTGLPVNSPRAINLRDRARVIGMLLTATAVYLVSFYIPLIYWTSGESHSRAGQYFFLWLVFAQNALNPLIYGLVAPQFREAYLRVLLWLLRRWSCRRPYGDSRRVYPTGANSSADAGGPPSVIYQSAKNSIVFPNQFNSNLAGMNNNNDSIANPNRPPTSARNLKLDIKIKGNSQQWNTADSQ